MAREDSVLQGSRESRNLETSKNIIQRLICGNEVDRSTPWVAYGDVLRSVIEILEQFERLAIYRNKNYPGRHQPTFKVPYTLRFYAGRMVFETFVKQIFHLLKC